MGSAEEGNDYVYIYIRMRMYMYTIYIYTYVADVMLKQVYIYKLAPIED